MSYTDVFGGENIFPSQLNYLALAMTADVTLQWPVEVALPGANVLPNILEIDADPGLSVSLPDASIGSTGDSLLVNNRGAETVSVLDFDGNNVGSVASGEVWQFYLADNTTPAGVWRTFEFGAGASSAVAAALAGAGLKAITTTLNVQWTPRSDNASPLAIIDSDRAKIVQWTGGVGAGTLLDPATVGSDWFVFVRNNGTGTWTITPAAGTINGAATLGLSPFSSALIYTDGANYYTIGLSQVTPTNFDYTSINVAGTGDYTLSGVELNRIAYRLTGALTGVRNIIVPSSVQQYWVNNQTSGGFDLTVKTAAGSGVLVPAGTAMILYSDATDVLAGEGAPASGLIPTQLGGTGLATYAQGDLLYASAAQTLARLAKNASATRYLSNTGGSNDPAWAQVDLTNGVTGLLPFANIADGSALSVFGRSANSVGVMASIAAGANDRLLTRVGDVLAFTQLTAGMFPNAVVPDAALSSNIPLKNGTNVWSGLNSFPVDDLVYDGSEVGFRGYPFDDDSPHLSNYTLESNDHGRCVFYSNGHGAGDAVTIPSNASGTFASLGITILVVNDDASNTLEVNIDTDTLYLAGTTTTGPQVIKAKGAALLYRTQSTEWIIIPLGNSIDYPAAISTVYAGYVDSAAAAEQVPAGWSVANTGTGLYTVTHNLGLAGANDLSITLTLVRGVADDTFINVITPGVNSFTLGIIDSGSGAVNSAFFFLCKRNT